MNRAEIKIQAKKILSQNYWYIIGAFVICLAIFSVASQVPAAIFFLAPVEMGLILVYLKYIDGEKTGIAEMFINAFDGKYYLRRVGGYAWMYLFTFLWSLLFVIPGIVKGYSYYMTPYILAKYPEIPAKEALKLSMKIMDGRKMELFVLHLSFIGWAILASLTCGLLGIFYVFPYMMITEIIWEKNVMQEVTDNGTFTYVA